MKTKRETLNNNTKTAINTALTYCGCGNLLNQNLETQLGLETWANGNKTQKCKDHCRHTYRIDGEKYCKVCSESC